MHPRHGLAAGSHRVLISHLVNSGDFNMLQFRVRI
jgi:hypothetical protein